MDYIRSPLIFRIRKVLRYIRLYGVSRTWMKVRAQYHMKREFKVLPAIPISRKSDPRRRVGIIGCGNFAYSGIAYYLTKYRGNVIRGCMDRHIQRAASLCHAFRGAYYTDNAEELLGDANIDLFYIASNHASHAEYAIRAIERGRSVHIEKPHVVNHLQLVRLCRAMATKHGIVGLGFNRPLSKYGAELQKAVWEQASPMVMNWFVAGHELPLDHWYYSEEEGGRVLGNLCHWTDFVLRMVPRDRRYPIRVVPARSDRSDCNIAVAYIFGDGSVASITFSAMGHTFEGVRERFAVHCRNVIARLDDFQSLSIERIESKRTLRGRTRDHGHAASILGSYDAAFARGDANDCGVEYVWETGDLFLRTREALERNECTEVTAFSPSILSDAANSFG
jgi:predicted dehydrogenase